MYCLLLLEKHLGILWLEHLSNNKIFRTQWLTEAYIQNKR